MKRMGESENRRKKIYVMQIENRFGAESFPFSVLPLSLSASFAISRVHRIFSTAMVFVFTKISCFEVKSDEFTHFANTYQVYGVYRYDRRR